MSQLSKLWEKGDEEKKSNKLKVEFTCVPEVIANPPTKSVTIATPPENLENLKSNLQRKGKEPEVSSSSPEVMVTELQNLRKKYDSVVEYTVNLTTERDNIVAQLETAQRELAKEKSKKKDIKEGNTRTEKKIEKVSSVVVIVAYFSCPNSTKCSFIHRDFHCLLF